MNELKLVELIRGLCGGGEGGGEESGGLVAGIGDDCAIVKPPAGEELLLTTDFLIEGVHFLRSTATGADAGWKALARGLSDIAAMGGRPRYALVSLALADWTTTAYVKQFYGGLRMLGDRHGVQVVGGDITQSRQFVCDVVVVGSVARGKALRRGGARPGDQICVTGRLGGAELGLETKKGPAWKRHLRPEPRVKEGARLRELKATACMDLSDGLALDLHRMCAASGVAADLDWRLPLFKGALLRHALLGGEDYELLFTVPDGAKLPEEIEGTMVTPIGRIVQGKPGMVYFAKRPLPAEGWDPFARKTAKRPVPPLALD